MPKSETIVTGVGIICAAGCGLEEVGAALGEGRSGLGPLTLFRSIRFGRALVGQVRADVDRLAGPLRGSRSDKLAWIAAREALDKSGLRSHVGKQVDPGRIGVVMGATVGGMTASEEVVRRLVVDKKFRGGSLRFHECACSTEACARAAGATGPCITLSTACSASALAIAAGAELIAGGEADVVLAGGSDALCRLTLNGFGSLLLVDPAGCRPFDAGRAGIALGEGAVVLVLESEESARARGAAAVARLSGWGSSCDAFHATAPPPDGHGAVTAMRRALQSAGLEPREIDCIAAHGTATKDNDIVEARALKQVFGEQPPPFTSTKGFFGHTLAASGAVQAAVCVDSLMRQRIPPNLGFRNMDPEIGLAPEQECRPARIDHMMSNSFGFGGSNVVLVFSRPDVDRKAAGPVHARAPGIASAASSSAGARFAIVGAGIVSPAGTGLAALFESCRRGAVAPCAREMPPLLPQGTVPGYACGAFGAETAIAAGRRRKLARLQQMALVAARQGVPTAVVAGLAPDRVCVSIGTGLGMLNEASSFVENMIVHDEKTPLPLCFTNSVHNALASQVALEFGLRGMNSTATQRDVTFEAALWHGMREMHAGNADLAIVGAADELNHYVLAAGVRWGWWNAGSKECAPFRAGLAGHLRPPTGEGATVFALARPEMAERPLAYVAAARVGMSARRARGDVDATKEAGLIRRILEQAGWPLDGTALLLTGANGRPDTDAQYRAVADALSHDAGVHIPLGAYKQWCGEFYSASAVGFMIALGIVRGELGIEHLHGPDASGAAARQPVRVVILYTLSATGARGVSCIGV